MFTALVGWASFGPKPAMGEENPNDLVIISDIDDTLRATRVKPDGNYIDLAHRFYSNQQFFGMSSLYRSLRENGARVHYVTSAPDFLKSHAVDFLHANEFPIGRTWTRRSLFFRSPEYKFKTISALMRNQPGRRFVLVGDDGEYDPEVFARLKREPDLAGRIDASFIHSVYGNNLQGSQSYLTSADLALRMKAKGYISEDQLKAVLEEVRVGMYQGHYKATLPDFSRVSRGQIQAAFRESEYVTGYENRVIAEEIERWLHRGATPIEIKPSAFLCPALFRGLVR